MKIFFEDGYLTSEAQYQIRKVLNDDNARVRFLLAGDGYSNNLTALNSENKDTILYTNSLLALSTDYCWNKEENRPDIWFRGKNGGWKHCTEFTLRELRYAHNLMKLYMAGEFRD